MCARRETVDGDEQFIAVGTDERHPAPQLVAAGVLAMTGKNSLDPSILAPNRTARNVRRDAETIKEAATHDTRR